jgi:serine/threonine protein phosphatase PrpC
MKFSIFQESRDGARKTNQDRIGYCYSREALLMVVADGLGGHGHGEVASQLTVKTLIRAFQAEARPRLEDPFRFLARNINDAHLALLAYAAGRQWKDTPRTTCVACIVQDGAAHWAHAGDSRLYHFRGGKVLGRTRDHSVVQAMIDAGSITEEEAATHPSRGRISNCLGSVAMPQVELSARTALEPDDTLLLCSDGLWGPLNDDHLAGEVARRDIRQSVPGLLDEARALAGATCDNLSVVAMTWAEKVEPRGQVSTQTLEPNTFATESGSPASLGEAGQVDLTDEEIEKAIEDIRAALRKYSNAQTRQPS